MSRQNRERAAECISGSGTNLSMGDKLALLLIGDLVGNGADEYWESQGSLARRMGTSPRSAGRAVRSLAEAGALTFDHWKRVGSGGTVKVFDYTPENVGTQVGETFQPDLSGIFRPAADAPNGQIGRNLHSHRKILTPTSEEMVVEVRSVVLQTGKEPEDQQIENRDKLAIGGSRDEETRWATA